jgi:hypothetical protein
MCHIRVSRVHLYMRMYYMRIGKYTCDAPETTAAVLRVTHTTHTHTHRCDAPETAAAVARAVTPTHIYVYV